jgi:hypothetical protein
MDFTKVLDFVAAIKSRDWLAAGELAATLLAQICHYLRGQHVDSEGLKATNEALNAALLSDDALADAMKEVVTTIQSPSDVTGAVGLNPILVVLVSEAIRRVAEEIIKRLNR